MKSVVDDVAIVPLTTVFWRTECRIGEKSYLLFVFRSHVDLLEVWTSDCSEPGGIGLVVH